MQEDIEHFEDVGSLDEKLESFLSHGNGDGRDLFSILKRNLAEPAAEASKGKQHFDLLAIIPVQIDHI